MNLDSAIQVAAEVFSTTDPEAKRKSQDEFWFWQPLLGDRHTYDTDNARKAQRHDHWLFDHRPEEDYTELSRRIRRASRRRCYPQEADWPEMMVCRSHQMPSTGDLGI